MKIMQILGGFCHWDATNVVGGSLERCEKIFSKDMVFVEVPDHVFEGWGYDGTANGNDRFLKPSAPDGWNYDDKTGTFYPEGEIKPSDLDMSREKLVAECLRLRRENDNLKEQIIEIQTALCELYEMGV